jgi:hypothetical protein
MPNPDNTPQIPKNQSSITDDQTGMVSRDWYRFFLNLLNKANAGSGGTVTSVNVSGGTTGLTTSGGPVTTSGTVTLAGTLAVKNGGTNATTSIGALTSLGAYPASNPNGYTNNTGTVTSIDVSGGTTGLTTSGGPVTTSGIVTLSGTLGIANGGTNATTAIAALTSLGAYPASNPNGYTNNTGTVTSVNATVPSLLSVSGVPITTSGTIALTYSGTPLPIANGGTNATTSIAALTSLGAYPASNPNGYETGTVTSVNVTVPSLLSVSGVPITTSGTVALTYSGTPLPIANGGTNATTAIAGFNNLSPITSIGDLILGNGTNSATRLGIGSINQVLTSNGTTATWGTVTATTATNLAGGTTGAVPYQSGIGATLFLTGNITTTPQFVTSTGTGTLAQAPTLTSSTGSGSVVLATSPSLTTPTLGVASATTINKVTLTAPATGSTLTIADGKTLTASNSITLAGTDSTTMTFPPASASVGYLNVPINSQSANYTTVLADSGKFIFHPSTDANARTFTIDSNANVAYAIGTVLTFVNMTAQVVTIAITSDTMYLTGTGITGSRSLAQYGMATAIKMTTTTWLISGSGLT